MTRNAILETLIGTLVVLLIAAGIVWLGWNEPLSYRFMSQEEITRRELELNPPPTPRSIPGTAEWNPNGTALDRAPWRRTRSGDVRYSREFDGREVGVPTESGKRPNTNVRPPE